GSRDNFFALGGHSLLAIQLHRTLRDQLGLARLGVTDIFRFPVLEAFQRHVSGLAPAQSPVIKVETPAAAPKVAPSVAPAVAAEPVVAAVVRPTPPVSEGLGDVMAQRRAMRQRLRQGQ
uniref:phosphopantetheine-binding protein n=1 Tax=Paracoccus sp. TaxID=267 RepID=UPI00289A9ED7